MTGEVFIVVEASRAGDSVVGAFSSIERARSVLPRHDTRRLENYRVEFHVVDEPPEGEQAWTVSMTRDGEAAEVATVILCSCGDDHSVLENSSYIEAGGKRMHLIVWAKTKGSALDAADRYREWLVTEQLWGEGELRLQAISASQVEEMHEAATT